MANHSNKFHFRTKYKLTFFAVIETKPVEIVFEITIDNIKAVHRNYVTL